MAAFNELAKAKIGESRNAIISECSDGGYTIAQQLVATEKGKQVGVFMKGAFHVDNLDGIENLYYALYDIIKNRRKNEV